MERITVGILYLHVSIISVLCPQRMVSINMICILLYVGVHGIGTCTYVFLEISTSGRIVRRIC